MRFTSVQRILQSGAVSFAGLLPGGVTAGAGMTSVLDSARAASPFANGRPGKIGWKARHGVAWSILTWINFGGGGTTYT
jgi:hypothetical protein